MLQGPLRSKPFKRCMEGMCSCLEHPSVVASIVPFLDGNKASNCSPQLHHHNDEEEQFPAIITHYDKHFADLSFQIYCSLPCWSLVSRTRCIYLLWTNRLCVINSINRHAEHQILCKVLMLTESDRKRCPNTVSIKRSGSTIMCSRRLYCCNSTAGGGTAPARSPSKRYIQCSGTPNLKHRLSTKCRLSAYIN